MLYWNGQLVWTPALALYLCVGGGGLCPAGFIAHLRLYRHIRQAAIPVLGERDLSPTFKRISDRICAASINLVNHKLIVISAYAPTLEVREANPELRELFYNQLDSTVSRDSCLVSTVGVASRDACVVLGDFNSFAYTYGHLPGAPPT